MFDWASMKSYQGQTRYDFYTEGMSAEELERVRAENFNNCRRRKCICRQCGKQCFCHHCTGNVLGCRLFNPKWC